MSSYAHLAIEAECPACGAALDVSQDLIAFQWGYCPSRQPWDDLFYSLGDEIRWRVDDASRIQPWVYFEGSLQGGNIGDPTIDSLLVRGVDLGGGDIVCRRCRCEGLALRIEGGRIVRLQPAIPGCDVAVLDGATGITPRPEWNDWPMPDCLRVRNRRLATSRGHVIHGKLAPG